MHSAARDDSVSQSDPQFPIPSEKQYTDSLQIFSPLSLPKRMIYQHNVPTTICKTAK